MQRKRNSRAVCGLKFKPRGKTIEALSAVIAILFTTTMKRGLHHHTIAVSTLHNGSYRTHLSTFLSPECTFRCYEPNPVFPLKTVSCRATPYISDTTRHDLKPSTTPKTMQCSRGSIHACVCVFEAFHPCSREPLNAAANR